MKPRKKGRVYNLRHGNAQDWQASRQVLEILADKAEPVTKEGISLELHGDDTPRSVWLTMDALAYVARRGGKKRRAQVEVMFRRRDGKFVYAHRRLVVKLEAAGLIRETAPVPTLGYLFARRELETNTEFADE